MPSISRRLRRRPRDGDAGASFEARVLHARDVVARRGNRNRDEPLSVMTGAPVAPGRQSRPFACPSPRMSRVPWNGPRWPHSRKKRGVASQDACSARFALDASVRPCQPCHRLRPGHVPTPWVLGLTSEPAIRRSHPVRPADSQSPLGVIGWVRKAPGSAIQQAPARPCVRWHSTTFIGSTACKAASSCPVRPCQRSGWHGPAPRIASPRRSPVPGSVTLGRVFGYMIRAGSSRCSRAIAWPSSWVTTARMTIGRVAAARACRNRSTLSHCVLNYA